MAKRILEFFPHQLAARKGGAYTYLYNLKQEIKDSEEVKIVFLSDIVDLQKSNSVHNPPSALKNIFKKFIPEKVLNNRKVLKYLDNSRKIIDKNIEAIELNDFNVVHFHEAIDILRYEHLLKNFRGKILFTPHSSIPYHMELLAEVFGLKKSGISATVCKKLEEIDQKAFETVQQLVLPCSEALEGYFSNWPIIEILIKNKPVHYLLTGCPPALPLKTKEEVLEHYQIPKDSFIVSFTGRHSPIKGFDLLEKAAEIILKDHNDIYFLVAGNKTGIEQFQHQNWIETGWTNDPASLINASDVNISANRETYFDLNILEAMSMAKPIILTETGGNRFLKQKINTSGLLFIETENVDNLVQKIKYCYQQKEKLTALGSQNRLAFEQNFTPGLFYKRYIELYKNI